MKSKELKSYNLPDHRLYNDCIDAKPIVMLMFIMSVGFMVMFLGLYVQGAAIFIVSAFSILFLPSRRLIEFYDDYMIVYNKARKDECNIIYYDDAKYFEYISSVYMDKVIITLSDDSTQSVSAFSKTKFEKQIGRYIPKKEK